MIYSYLNDQIRWRRRDAVLILELILIGVLILVCASEAGAQTVSPVAAEAKGPKARGEFSLTNNQIVPLAVFVEATSAQQSTLAPGVTVRLANSSARLGPKQTYVFQYEVECAALPCAVNFWATLTGLHTKDGLAVALHLPSVLYVCDRAKDCRANTLRTWAAH